MKKLFQNRFTVIALLVKWSGIGMTEGHGKLGGTVIQKGRSGFIARVKVTPVNPQSEFQQSVRSLLAYFSSKFRTLGDTVVAGWNAAAANGFITNNVFGDPIKQTGHGLYVGLNMNLIASNNAEITNAPTPEGVPSPLGISPAAATGANLLINAEFVGGTDVVPASTTLLVFATPPLSGGVTFVKNKFRLIGLIAAAGDTGTDDLGTEYGNRFGVPSSGDRYAVRVVTVNNSTGEAGIPLQKFVTVS